MINNYGGPFSEDAFADPVTTEKPPPKPTGGFPGSGGFPDNTAEGNVARQDFTRLSISEAGNLILIENGKLQYPETRFWFNRMRIGCTIVTLEAFNRLRDDWAKSNGSEPITHKELQEIDDTARLAIGCLIGAAVLFAASAVGWIIAFVSLRH